MTNISLIIETVQKLAKKYSHLSVDKLRQMHPSKMGFNAEMQVKLFYHFAEIHGEREKGSDNYTLQELELIFKGAVIASSSAFSQESNRGCENLMGSVSCAPHIYFRISEKSYTFAKEMRKWAVDFFGVCPDLLPNDAYYIAKYSNNIQEKNIALEELEELHKKQKRKAAFEAKRQAQNKERTSNTRYLKMNDKTDREAGLRDVFLAELNKLSLEEKFIWLINDTRHSPKYYPKNMAGAASNEFLLNLEDSIIQKLIEKFNKVNLKRSPWNKFKQRLLSLTKGYRER